MANPIVQIKGLGEGLLVIPADGEWDEIHHAILKHIDEQTGFFQGARLALDLGNHVLKAAELLTKPFAAMGSANRVLNCCFMFLSSTRS